MILHVSGVQRWVDHVDVVTEEDLDDIAEA